MEFISLSFNDDLEKAALHLAGNKAVLIYPTRSAAGFAQCHYLDDFFGKDLQFMSMEDFEAATILADAPVLSEEKRLICLYLVLSDEDKETLHIASYGDIVEWGKRFFDLFGELAEECIPAEDLNSLPDNGLINLQQWQELYLERILKIRSNYRSYIGELGFTDRIFYLGKKNFANPWGKQALVFVNQYYYGALHKDLLRFLEQAGHSVHIIYQGVELQHRDGTWKVLDLDLGKAWQELQNKPQIRIVECENEKQMAPVFLDELARQGKDDGNKVILDSHFFRKSYQRYFDPRHFRQVHHYSICGSDLYQVLASIAEGMKAMHSRDGYLPMQLISELLVRNGFVRYFSKNGDADEQVLLLNQLQDLLQKDYLYLDEECLLAMDECSLKGTLLNYYGHLKAFGRVDSIAALCELFDAPEGLDFSRLIDADEARNTGILQSFWERVANFYAIKELGIMPEPKAMFAAESLAQELLELFLQYLKSARVAYQPLEAASPQWEISNLLDSRNRSFRELVFFQMVEGLVPSAPTPVWIFSEAQRKRLGMKSYDDIRAWERYYFFRLVLLAEKVSCYSYRNVEQDIGPSSFLGELQFVLSENDVKLQVEKPKLSIADIYLERQSQDYPGAAALAELDLGMRSSGDPEPEFFILPIEASRDYGEAAILKSSVSGILQFVRNPFLWYLESKSRIGQTSFEAEETIGPKLFGNIMHDFFATILHQYQGHHNDAQKLEDLFAGSRNLQDELLAIIRGPKFRYQIPKNYNGEFLAEIISRRLAESLQEFYHSWLKNKIAHKSFELIPETEEMTSEEKLYRCLGETTHEGKTYKILVRGRADLRIEMDQEALIVDFKTGSKDLNQLIIYEWLYYLLDERLPEENISSIFWLILEASASKDKINPEKRIALRASIMETLSKCLSGGYHQGKKTADRQRLKGITRADIYHPQKEAQDA